MTRLLPARGWTWVSQVTGEAARQGHPPGPPADERLDGRPEHERIDLRPARRGAVAQVPGGRSFVQDANTGHPRVAKVANHRPPAGQATDEDAHVRLARGGAAPQIPGRRGRIDDPDTIGPPPVPVAGHGYPPRQAVLEDAD